MKKISSAQILSVMDFGYEKVRILTGVREKDQSFRVLGAGESPSMGIRDGEITHLGDAAESVMAAAEKAEASSGLAIKTLYYNFDDDRMQSLLAHGSKSLEGQGEIRTSDVRQAAETALRLVGDYQKSVVYARQINFLIDDRDAVAEPVGVFGRKLEIRLHVLMARAGHCEAWRKLVERAGIDRSIPVLSAWSAAYAVLPKEDRKRKRLILDAGRDFLNIFIFGNNMISDSRTLLTEKAGLAGETGEWAAVLKEWTRREADLEETLVTGDLADDKGLIERLRAAVSLPVRRVAPSGVAALGHPSYASLVGLLFVADELERKSPGLSGHHGLLATVKQKAVSLFHEYF